MTVIWILGIVLVLEAAGCFLYRRMVPRRKRNFINYLLRNEIVADDTTVRASPLTFVPHPFTCFEPNPEFRNAENLKIHNFFSFRDSQDYRTINFDDFDLRIYLAGGSTVYDCLIEKNEDTFAARLERYLADSMTKQVKVVNAGVGNWTTYQSVIRLSAWIDVIKPHLIVLYQGLNDITPFLYTDEPKEGIRPDYAHSLRSFCLLELKNKIPFYAKYSFSGKFLFGMRLTPEDANIRFYTMKGGYKVHHIGKNHQFGIDYIRARVNYDYIKTHFLNLIALASFRKIPVVFLTERLQKGDEWLRPFLVEINRIIREELSTYENCYVLDFDRLFPSDQKYFMDCMHFSEKGNRKRAELTGAFIKDLLAAR